MRSMTTRGLPFLLAALLLSAGQVSGQSDPQEPATPTARLHLQAAGGSGDPPVATEASGGCRIRVTSPQTADRRVFSATEILDLDLRVTLRGDITGEHLLHIKVHTPGGHLYQTLTVPFTTDLARSGALRAVDGYPRPLTVQQVEHDTEGGRAKLSVLASLPVAGTSIVHSSLYGKWTAEAYLDEATESCGRARAFFLQP